MHLTKSPLYSDLDIVNVLGHWLSRIFFFGVRQCTWPMWPSKKPAPTMTRRKYLFLFFSVFFLKKRPWPTMTMSRFSWFPFSLFPKRLPPTNYEQVFISFRFFSSLKKTTSTTMTMSRFSYFIFFFPIRPPPTSNEQRSIFSCLLRISPKH